MSESDYYLNPNFNDDNERSFDIVTGIVIGIIVASIIWGIGKSGKYEGQTAEGWYNEYDWLVGCVEDSTNPKLECL